VLPAGAASSLPQWQVLLINNAAPIMITQPKNDELFCALLAIMNVIDDKLRRTIIK
jgi:hypothetical protein